ncbi:MAG TPA: GH92 family glycosyl hydrolase [Actinomycetota bacterium]|nr:GH92 family glycosyl hydrolase [Actinomycetota bacterium]
MRRASVLLLLAVLLPAGAVARPAASATDSDPARYVDPFIGTLGSGFVFPGPAAPFGMVQLSPDTEGYFAYTGYLYSDRFIRGFSHVHIQSMGVHMGGNLPFMPTVGAVQEDPLQYMSPFDHSAEEASPGYYGVRLGNGVHAELTAGLRVGVHRYTFPSALPANVIMDVGRSVPRESGVPLRPAAHASTIEQLDGRTVSGSATMSGRAPYTVYFAARYSRPFDSIRYWNPGGRPDSRSAAVTFAGGGEVTVEVGISYVDEAGALRNLDSEETDFDSLRAATREAWNDALGAIRVTGGTDADRTSFYTALYHAQHHPNVFSDADGRWRGYDGQVHTADGWTPYANFSMWDTYRGQMPLLSVIQPDRYRDMTRTLLEAKRQRTPSDPEEAQRNPARFPKWALNNTYPDYMVGEPVMPVLAEAWCRDLVDVDIASDLYTHMREQVLTHHREPSFVEHGFARRGYGGASETLEYAIAAFSFALVADRLGHQADRDAALALARNWASAIDPEIGFARPRQADGSYRAGYDPMMPDGFVEGTGWQYTWLVPHDVAGLFDVIGRVDPVSDRLDTFFSTWLAAATPTGAAEAQKHITAFGIAYYGNQYAPSNEHDLQAPYMYDWTDEPWKTQAVVRGLQSLYRPLPDGLPGNDDLGTLSSWYVWSALGLYPTVSGAPLYTVGSPVFERAEIAVPGGTFTVRSPGASPAAKYVKAATLDGQTFDATWLPDSALRPGGELVLEMDVLPNREWGASKPPSLSAGDLSAFGCRAG